MAMHVFTTTTLERPAAALPAVLAAILAIGAIAGSCGTRDGGASSAPAGPTDDGGAVPSGFPLVGTWTVDITKADLEAAGVTDPGLRNENSGRFTWTFAADGTWTSVQESLDGSAIMSPVYRGTYAADRGAMTVRTDFPEQYRDDGLHYTWTIDGDGVRLDVLDPPDPVLPLIVETKPWRRVN